MMNVDKPQVNVRKTTERVSINPNRQFCSSKYLQKMWKKNHIPASFSLQIMPFVSVVIGRVTPALNAYLKLWEN